ncbi:ZFP2 [Acrasis kona]|uniref:ZFP2 n=1 Tax=Acrasis kona TaxID=1008807 RepID=A0AAW2ZDQ1_9EUKA
MQQSNEQLRLNDIDNISIEELFFGPSSSFNNQIPAPEGNEFTPTKLESSIYETVLHTIPNYSAISPNTYHQQNVFDDQNIYSIQFPSPDKVDQATQFPFKRDLSEVDNTEDTQPSKKRRVEKFKIYVQIISIKKNEDGSYNCDVCQKHFTDRSNLSKHIRVHTKEKPYECKECQKSFSHSQSLKEHSNTHQKKTPYACEECKKTFSNDANLKRHMRTHTLEKPYKCTECGAEFSQSNNCKLHMSSKHGLNVSSIKKSK